MAELSKKQITRLKAWRTEFERMLEADDIIKKLDTEAGFSTQQRMDAETALRSIDQMLANAIGDGTPAIDVRKKKKT